MNCTQCGAPIEENSGFCDQCGAKVERIKEEQEMAGQQVVVPQEESPSVTAPANEATHKSIMPTQKMHEDLILEEAIHRENRHKRENIQMFMQPASKYALKDKTQQARSYAIVEEQNELRLFMSIIIAILKNPLISSEELKESVKKSYMLFYTLILVIMSGCTTFITYKLASGNFLKGMFSLTTQLGAYFELEPILEDLQASPFIQEAGVKVFSYVVLSHAILMVLMLAILLLIAKVNGNVEMSWHKGMLVFIVVLTVLCAGKLGVLAMTLISGTLGFYFYLLMMLTVLVITVLQFVNLLDEVAFGIYVVPLVYLVSAFIRNKVIMEIIKMSLSKYIYMG